MLSNRLNESEHRALLRAHINAIVRILHCTNNICNFFPVRFYHVDFIRCAESDHALFNTLSVLELLGKASDVSSSVSFSPAICFFLSFSVYVLHLSFYFIQAICIYNTKVSSFILICQCTCAARSARAQQP